MSTDQPLGASASYNFAVRQPARMMDCASVKDAARHVRAVPAAHVPASSGLLVSAFRLRAFTPPCDSGETAWWLRVINIFCRTWPVCCVFMDQQIHVLIEPRDKSGGRGSSGNELCPSKLTLIRIIKLRLFREDFREIAVQSIKRRAPEMTARKRLKIATE